MLLDCLGFFERMSWLGMIVFFNHGIHIKNNKKFVKIVFYCGFLYIKWVIYIKKAIMFNNTTLSNTHLDLNLIKAIFRVVVEPNFFLSNLIFLFKLIFLVFLYWFDVLMLKINFKNKKIILMHFQTKNNLKINLYHILKTS